MYEPKLPPDVADPELQKVIDWAKEELAAIALDGAALNSLELRVVHAEPDKPREGMIVEADGTDWDPGEGAGQYSFRGGVWKKQYGTGDTLTLASNITDEGALAYLSEVDLAHMADLQNHRLIGRNTAGTGEPEAVSIETVLDWMSATRGRILRRGSTAWEALALGSAGQRLTSDGTDALWAAAVDEQSFGASDGTWTKPATGTWALILMWGPGGSGAARNTDGNASGGGGGAFVWKWVKLSDMGATETYTAGVPGASVSGNADGIAGTSSTFGAHLTAPGGGGGDSQIAANAANGGFGAGVTPGSTGIEATITTVPTLNAHTKDGGAPGGSITGATIPTGGDAYNGGGGGGGAASSNEGLGGTSVHAGDGGKGENTSGNATDGSSPSGGGGGVRQGGNSGKGGDPKCIVLVF